MTQPLQPRQPQRPQRLRQPQTQYSQGTIPLPTAQTRSLRRFWKHDPADDQAVAQAEEAQTQLLPQRPQQSLQPQRSAQSRPPFPPREMAESGEPTENTRIENTGTGTETARSARTVENTAIPETIPLPARQPHQPRLQQQPQPYPHRVQSIPREPINDSVPLYDAPEPEPEEDGPEPDDSEPGELGPGEPIPPTPQWDHTRGAGLVWVLGVALALMGARTPLWTLVVALVIVWCVTARGHAMIAEHRRMFERGGFAVRSDRAKMALLTPWYLLQSLPRVLGAALLWFVLATAVNLTMTLALGAPHAQTTLHILSWTLTLPLLSGSPQSLASLVWGITTGGWWLLVALCGKVTSARSAGFQSAQGSIRNGWAKMRRRRGTATGVFLIVATAALLLIGIGSFFVIHTTDWSPLPLTMSLQDNHEPIISFTPRTQQPTDQAE